MHIALQAQACDSLQRYQEREIQAGLDLQVVSDSLLFNERREVIMCKVIQGQYIHLYEGEKQLTKIEKQKKRRRTWLVIGVAGLWIVREFVDGL